MTNLLKLIESPADVIVTLLIAYLAWKELHEGCCWIKARLEEYRESKNHSEDNEKRIKTLEEKDIRKDEILNEIMNVLGQIKEELKTNEKNRSDDIVNSTRATIYLLADQFRGRGSLTAAEYEAFEGLSKTYLENGGNSVYKHKIIPEILALPVQDKEDIEE